MKIDRIDSISLDSVLPVVFSGEKIPESMVWKTSLKLERGNNYRIEASSGGGKSSLCSFIYGERRDYEGKILFNDTDIRNLTISEWQSLRRENLAYLSQDLMLFPELTAICNIELKNQITNAVSSEQISDWLQFLGIYERKDSPVGKMSVGQQQRVGIIRALCQPFDFILLDEPVSHLDRENNKKAASIVTTEARRRNAGIISTSVGNHLLIEDSQSIML